MCERSEQRINCLKILESPRDLSSSILQRHSGPEFATLKGQVAQQARTEPAFSIIRTQDQVLGCHA